MPDVTNPTKHDISPAVGRREKTIRSRPALTTQQLQDQPGLHEISLEKKPHKTGQKEGTTGWPSAKWQQRGTRAKKKKVKVVV